MAVNVENDGNTEKFPYRILNDLSKKLKSAEDKIATLLDERESYQMSCNVCNQAVLVLPESTNEAEWLFSKTCLRPRRNHVTCLQKNSSHKT